MQRLMDQQSSFEQRFQAQVQGQAGNGNNQSNRVMDSIVVMEKLPNRNRSPVYIRRRAGSKHKLFTNYGTIGTAP